MAQVVLRWEAVAAVDFQLGSGKARAAGQRDRDPQRPPAVADAASLVWRGRIGEKGRAGEQRTWLPRQGTV